MKTLYIDTNVLIYFSQPHSEFFIQASNVFRFAAANDYKVIISSLGIAEFLALDGNDGLVQDILGLLSNLDITEVPFDHSCAVLFGELRRKLKKKVHPLDITHLAAAKQNEADILITNDAVLHNIEVGGLRIVPLLIFSSQDVKL